MFSTKTVFAVALIAFCYFSFGHSLKCYVCDSVASCNTSVPIECNQMLANNTNSYLNQFYTRVDFSNRAGYEYTCLRDFLNLTTGYHYYKGCVLDNRVNGVCDMELRKEFMPVAKSRFCSQCKEFDGCNPAGFVNINIKTIFATVIVVFMAHFLWH